MSRLAADMREVPLAPDVAAVFNSSACLSFSHHDPTKVAECRRASKRAIVDPSTGDWYISHDPLFRTDVLPDQSIWEWPESAPVNMRGLTHPIKKVAKSWMAALRAKAVDLELKKIDKMKEAEEMEEVEAMKKIEKMEQAKVTEGLMPMANDGTKEATRTEDADWEVVEVEATDGEYVVLN